jgi:UDP-N-acetylmuramoyl-tripeptide--D-alanyl-D-alanine ligase
MKNFTKRKLASLARKTLKKYRPTVVIINGSIGKSSAKEAVFAVLSSKFSVRRNIKSYNNEFGLPLTILGFKSPKRNPFKWLSLFVKSFAQLHGHKDYPKVLILEMGVDRPGDMDYLLEIAHPDRAIFTTAGISHLEFFSSQRQILEEEGKGVKALSPQGYAILNADDAEIKKFSIGLQSNKIMYGKDPQANLLISNVQSHYSAPQKSFGTSFKLKFKETEAEVFLENILGWPHVSASAAGVATGLSMGMSLDECIKGLKNYEPEKARMHVVSGMRGSYIIDDTYNSAPLSAKVALEELRHLPVARKIVVLGDMLELGSMSDQSHYEIADEVLKDSIDFFVGVGPQTKLTARRLKDLGFKPERIFSFDKSTDAIEQVKSLLSENCAILVKGSQGMRMERLVKGIMEEPDKAGELLCRQDKEWLKGA